MLRMKRLVVAGVALALGMVATAVATQPVMASSGGEAATLTYDSYEDAVPGIAPPGSDATAIFLDRDGQPISIDGIEATSMEAAAWACTPVSGRDNPHYSSGDASGHGWWKKGTCDNNRADVYNCLYEWYTDNSWRNKACSNIKRLRPYTGSGDRTVARRACDNQLVTTWRNYVDVDVVDEWDTGEQPYREDDIGCRVY